MGMGIVIESRFAQSSVPRRDRWGGETTRMRVLEDAQPQRCCPDAEEARSTLRTRTDRRANSGAS